MRSSKLLIVDDSRLIVQIVTDYFVSMDYQVFQAMDAQEAMRRLEAHRPHVIVSDILMPGIDGWELFDQVRSDPRFAEIPFVFLTTQRELPQKLRGFHAGADDYVTKPFDVEELYARVERILEGRRRLENARRGEGAALAGNISHLPLPDLLQILALNGNSGAVYLRREAEEEEEGVIYFEEGKVVHAWAGPVAGTKALYRMLTWEDAAFRVIPGDAGGRKHTVDQPISSVMMDGMVWVDEWNRWKDRLPAPEATLRINGAKRQEVRADSVSEPEFEVLSRSSSGESVARILDDSPLLDGALAQAICSLLEREILLPADSA